MSITKKFGLLLALMVVGVGALAMISARVIAFNDSKLKDLQDHRLTVLLNTRSMVQNFSTYNKDVEIALTTREPQFVESNVPLIKKMARLARESQKLASVERQNEFKDLLTLLEPYPDQMTRFVDLNLNSDFSDPEFLAASSAIIQRKTSIERVLSHLAERSDEEFHQGLKEIHDYNNQLAGTMPYIFGLAILAIAILIAPVLIGITGRLKRLGNHFVSSDLQTLEPAAGAEGADEIATLVLAYNKMLDKIKADRKQLVDKEFVDKIIATLASMLVVTDPTGRIFRVNDVARRKLQEEAADLCNMSLFDLIAGNTEGQPVQSQADALSLLKDKLKAGVAFKLETALTKADTSGNVATTIPAMLNVTPLTDKEGNLSGYVCLAQDLTERILAEKDRRSMQNQLAHTARLASLGTLGAGVAHELNNPLAAIRGFSEILLRPNTDPEKVRSRAEKIFHATLRMQKIVSHLHSFSRTGSQDERKPVDINAPVRDSLIILEEQLRIRGIEVELNLGENLPPVHGDANQLESVVQNLIANARDAYDDKVDSLNKKIAVRTSFIAPNTVRVVVEDQAGGIPDHVKDRIFDPFFTTKQVGKGTGLGLSIVHGIIESHGGKVTLETTLGKGTRFTIDFPAATPVKPSKDIEAGETSSQAQTKARPDAGKLQILPREARRKILIVDDEALITDLLGQYLEDLYHVTAVNDPRTAIEVFKSGAFDLLITDVKMPHLSGPEVIKQIREVNPHLPVVVMSGHAAEDVELQQNLTDLSCEFIQKPFESQDSIQKTIANILPLSEASHAA